MLMNPHDTYYLRVSHCDENGIDATTHILRSRCMTYLLNIHVQTCIAHTLISAHICAFFQAGFPYELF